MKKAKKKAELSEAEIARFAKLEETLGYSFKRKELLKKALSHSSYANEMRTKQTYMESNERLEFLGDAVLALITSEYLYRELGSKHSEGELSRVRSSIVCESSLYEFAKSMELGEYLYLGKGEEATHGRERRSILADAFEAVLGAVYMDSGLNAAKKFLLKYVSPIITEFKKDGNTKDYKTLLQQIVQRTPGELLEYVLVCESGPAHERSFESHVLLNNNIIGKGISFTKREAEQAAAKEALSWFGV